MDKLAMISLAAAMVGASPFSRDFSCRNKAAEILCEGGVCGAETDSFTPMALARTGGLITFCAYSGCWEGRIAFSRSRSGVDFLQARVRREQSTGQSEQWVLSIMFSRREQTAQISWNGFFSVMGCGS